MQWTDVKPGDYEIGLTVTNDLGMTDHTTIKVHVSYAGYWNDFEIAGNTSGNAVELDFTALVHYDKDDPANTISRAQIELEYPKEDGDCQTVLGDNCRAELNIYAYNEEEKKFRTPPRRNSNHVMMVNAVMNKTAFTSPCSATRFRTLNPRTATGSGR